MLGWKQATKKATARCEGLFAGPFGPNLADLSGQSSAAIAGEVYRVAGIPMTTTRADLSGNGGGQQTGGSGAALEVALEDDLRRALQEFEPERGWSVTRSGSVSQFSQYSHLAELQRLFNQQPALRSTIGSDYEVATDVMVSLPNPVGATAPRLLHAAVSSKLTIRSDRVQNIRYEFGTLVRTRKGRLPHLVVVTAEPLPSRLLSIARGTGEIDAVYHLLFDEMEEVAGQEAVPGLGQREWLNQRAAWREAVDQGRIRPYSDLVSTIARG